MRHTVIIRDGLEARGAEVATFRAAVTFTWIPALVGNWHDEPPYAAYGELQDVRQIDGPTLSGAGLVEWADDWLAEQGDLEEALARDGSWACAARAEREYRAEQAVREKAMREQAAILARRAA